MPPVIGIFVLAELRGETAQRIRDIQLAYDPKLAAKDVPHVTLAGSSGVGSIAAGTPARRIREALEPIARSTAPLTLAFGAPIRFMQTNIVSLPLDPHGPLRTLHERIAASGLSFGPSRFPFSPHCTLTFFPTLTPARLRELLAIRVETPARIDRLQVYHTADPQPSRKLVELELTGPEEPRLAGHQRR